MKADLRACLVAASLLSIACGSGETGGKTEGAGAGSSDGGGQGASGTGSGANGSGSGGSLPNGCSDGYPIPPTTLLSRGAPAFASSGDPAPANDDNPASAWNGTGVPAWIAYDLSGAPKAQRGKVLVSWYAIHAPCYIDEASPPGGERPLAYTLEANTAPGGATPPEGGWTTLATIEDNRYCGRQHFVDMGGANWIRMHVTQTSPDIAAPAIEVDVQDASAGGCDSWLFMGDSITYMTMTHAFCDLPNLVHAAKPDYFPAVLDAALGGTNTGTAVEVIDDTMKDFPGRFVVLAYGTNDHPDGFIMEELVKKVIAAGKVPVVPRMIWSGSKLEEGPAINAIIDALYEKYPEILPGPDLWAAFENREEWLPGGEIHPNGEGQAELRRVWAEMMQTIYR
jgi:acyl-CoA thioesterase I